MTIQNLKLLQINFQNTILNNKHKAKLNIISSQNLSAKQKLKIYQNGYYERIIVAMQQDFPIINALLKDEAFSSLICDYIDAYPSCSFTLRTIGKNLSQFLKSKDELFLPFADLAELEYLMCQPNVDITKIKFKSDFNIIDVFNCFHLENKLIEIKETRTKLA